MDTQILIEKIKRINAIADLGLLYATTEFEIERYRELQAINFEILGNLTGQPIITIQNFYSPKEEYPTVKVDIRGLVLDNNKRILLVQEQSDQCWSLPGGWADIGFSPSETVIKEIKEETGLKAFPKGLLAVFDKKCHPHPPQPYYIYKLIIHCEIEKAHPLKKGFDILDADYFSVDQLPPLSENRILGTQIKTVYNRLIAGEKTTIFD